MCSLFILELSHPIPYTHDLQGTMLINQTKRLRKSNWNFQAKCAKIEILLIPRRLIKASSAQSQKYFENITSVANMDEIFWSHY